MEKIYLSNLQIKNLRLENSHDSRQKIRRNQAHTRREELQLLGSRPKIEDTDPA